MTWDGYYLFLLPSLTIQTQSRNNWEKVKGHQLFERPPLKFFPKGHPVTLSCNLSAPLPPTREVAKYSFVSVEVADLPLSKKMALMDGALDMWC